MRDLEIFRDSCAGQNKNWTVIRFAHYSQKFDSIKIIFPVREHSYHGCDRNITVIDEKSRLKSQMNGKRNFEMPDLSQHHFK